MLTQVVDAPAEQKVNTALYQTAFHIPASLVLPALIIHKVVHVMQAAVVKWKVTKYLYTTHCNNLITCSRSRLGLRLWSQWQPPSSPSSQSCPPWTQRPRQCSSPHSVLTLDSNSHTIIVSQRSRSVEIKLVIQNPRHLHSSLNKISSAEFVIELANSCDGRGK